MPRNGNTNSELLTAAKNGHNKTVLSLLENGAKINVGDKFGRNALMWAASGGHKSVVDVLINISNVRLGSCM